jgi:hypothetical protein
MHRSTTCAAAAALLGSSLLVGCASDPLPASPVAAPLTDRQAIELAEDHLDRTRTDAPMRLVNYVEPTAEGDGHFVSFRETFDPMGKPPAQTRLVLVEHDGSARELRFRRDE